MGNFCQQYLETYSYKGMKNKSNIFIQNLVIKINKYIAMTQTITLNYFFGVIFKNKRTVVLDYMF